MKKIQRKQAGRIAVWIFSLLLLWFMALFRGTYPLFFIAVLVTGVPPCSWLLNEAAKNALSASVRLPVSCIKGQEVEINLVVNNSGYFPVILTGKLTWFNELTDETGSEIFRLGIGPKDKEEQKFCFPSAHCGYLRVFVEETRLWDWMEIFTRKTGLEGKGKMAILPETFMLHAELCPPAAQGEEEELYAPNRKGEDLTELFQIREYQPGDHMKQIHWKLSGKLDGLFIREGSDPLARTLTVLWNKNVGGGDPDLRDRMAEVIVSLCQEISRKGIPYTLLWSEGAMWKEESVESSEDLLACIPRLLRGKRDETASLPCWEGRRGKLLYFGEELTDDLSFFSGDIHAFLPEKIQAPFPVTGIREELEFLVL